MDAFSLKILKVYGSRQKLSLVELGAILNQSPIELGRYVLRLKDKAYLCVPTDHAAFQPPNEKDLIGPNTPLQITIDGKELSEDTDRADKQRKRDFIRNAITIGISVVSAIIALIALLAQLGLIALPRL